MDQETHHKNHGNNPDHRPQQTKPKGAHLPAKMAFQPGPLNLIKFYIVDDDGDDRSDTCKISKGIKPVNDERQLLE